MGVDEEAKAHMKLNPLVKPHYIAQLEETS